MDVQEYSGTRYGGGWLITTETDEFKNENEVTSVKGKEGCYSIRKNFLNQHWNELYKITGNDKNQ